MMISLKLTRKTSSILTLVISGGGISVNCCEETPGGDFQETLTQELRDQPTSLSGQG